MKITSKEIQFLLAKVITRNPSRQSVQLGVDQSLLLLIDAVQQTNINNNHELNEYLRNLFLEGCKTEKDKSFIDLVSHAYSHFNITIDVSQKALIELPAKRYFETLLARKILTGSAGKLNSEKLLEYRNTLIRRLKLATNGDNIFQTRLKNILNGQPGAGMINYEVEFADLIHKLKTEQYRGLPKEVCQILCLIAANTILSTLISLKDKHLPVNTYDASVFSMDLGGRGRIKTKHHKEVVTAAQGMIRNTTPVSPYDENAYDAHDGMYITNKDELIPTLILDKAPFQRPSDQSMPMNGSRWNEYFFKRMLQPYSNGISSTTFAHIRTIILQKRLGNPGFSNKDFQEYITNFAALLVFSGGGHSFFEIFEVFKLDQLSEVFDLDTKEALKKDELMRSWLRYSHEDAFEEALQSSITYTKIQFNKKIMHAELLTHSSGEETKEIPRQNPSALYAVIQDNRQVLQEILEISPGIIDKQYYGNFSLFRIAAQLGRVHCMEMLLDAGQFIDECDCRGEYTALDLAIKNNQESSVDFLLNKGASISCTHTPSKSGALKQNAFTLYLVARQRNAKILELVLNNFELSDRLLENMIEEAVKVENTNVVLILVNKYKEKFSFSAQFKERILLCAIRTGNSRLFNSIWDQDFSTNLGKMINIFKLYNETMAYGFKETAQTLLDIHLSSLDDNKENLDSALLTAINFDDFLKAMQFIVKGADPFILDPCSDKTQQFLNYLSTVDNKTLFDSFSKEQLQGRVRNLKQYIRDEDNSILHTICYWLCKIINEILPTSKQFLLPKECALKKEIVQKLEKLSPEKDLEIKRKHPFFFIYPDPEDNYEQKDSTNFDDVQNVF